MPSTARLRRYVADECSLCTDKDVSERLAELETLNEATRERTSSGTDAQPARLAPTDTDDSRDPPSRNKTPIEQNGGST